MAEVGIVLRSGRALRQRSPRRPAIKPSELVSILQRSFKVDQPPTAEEQVHFSDKIDPQLLRPFSVSASLPEAKPILQSRSTAATPRESKLTFWTVAIVFLSLVSLWMWSFWLAISSPQYNLTMDESGGLSISQTPAAPDAAVPEYAWPEPPHLRGWPR